MCHSELPGRGCRGDPGLPGKSCWGDSVGDISDRKDARRQGADSRWKARVAAAREKDRASKGDGSMS